MSVHVCVLIGLVDKKWIKSLQGVDFCLFAKIIADMVKNAFSAGLPMWSRTA